MLVWNRWSLCTVSNIAYILEPQGMYYLTESSSVYNFTAEHWYNQSRKWCWYSEWGRAHWHGDWRGSHTITILCTRGWAQGEPHFFIGVHEFVSVFVFVFARRMITFQKVFFLFLFNWKTSCELLRDLITWKLSWEFLVSAIREMSLFQNSVPQTLGYNLGKCLGIHPPPNTPDEPSVMFNIWLSWSTK